MKKTRLYPLVACLLLVTHSYAQPNTNRTVQGNVKDYQDRSLGLEGANIYTSDLSVQTQTDKDGNFSIELPDTYTQLIISYAGYNNDTLNIRKDKATYNSYLKLSKSLKEVKVIHRKKSTEISTLGVLKTERIGQRELLKAACCNLSESFETTPSVDVAFTDAVTGYKQIQMLGLSGPNTLFTRENIPDIRGLASITGLTFTPGTWIEGMQLSKGTGSVVNGAEGLAGQINIEWRKPFEDAEKWYFNLYQNSQGRTEGNIVHKIKVSDKLSTNFFVHARNQWMRLDQNKDGYMDQPLGNQAVFANRWFAFLPKMFELQWGIKGTYADALGGQTDFKKGEATLPGKPWGYESDIKRIEAWAKIGKMFPDKKWKSMGLQLAAFTHLQNATYGQNTYIGSNQNVYANYIYQSIIDNTNHVIKMGASFNFDRVDESTVNVAYLRKELNTGVFSEYSYSHLEKFNLVAGIRADYNNLWGLYFTPRIHARYAPWYNAALRASIGRAQRTANFIAENMAFLASNRVWSVPPGTGYTLQPEVAWNYGINFTQKFKLNYREGTFSIDAYHSNYQNQVVVDMESPDKIQFYNLNGTSYANSIQVQLDYEPIRKLDVRVAYRRYDVKTQYLSGFKTKPLVATDRAFINIAYAFRKGWNVDYTLQWVGSKRVPVTFSSPTEMRAGYSSPSYFLMNAQVSKSWKNNLELYLGGENLAGIMQPQLILGAQNPYEKGFDASVIWGSAMGRNIYMGVRYKIK